MKERWKIALFLKKCECGCGCDHQKSRCGAEVRADQLLKCGCACTTQQNFSQPNICSYIKHQEIWEKIPDKFYRYNFSVNVCFKIHFRNNPLYLVTNIEIKFRLNVCFIPYLLDVLCRQQIKLFQVVSTSEFHEYWWNDLKNIFLVPAAFCRASEARTQSRP